MPKLNETKTKECQIIQIFAAVEPKLNKNLEF